MFTTRYVAAGGSTNGARSYVAYLNRLDRLCGGIDAILAREGATSLLKWSENQPADAYGGERNRRDSLSAIRKYVQLVSERPFVGQAQVSATEFHPDISSEALQALLAEARDLGARYYRLTGKPLGVTGEVAELAAAEKLGVELAVARQTGFDGWLTRGHQRLRVQIKGRAVSTSFPYVGRCPSILCGDFFDICMLVLLDRNTLAPFEIWEATEQQIAERLAVPGSKARNERNSLGISQFKSIAQKTWSS